MEFTDHKEEYQQVFNHPIWLTQPPSWNKQAECLTELAEIDFFYSGNSGTQLSATPIQSSLLRSGTNSERTNSGDTALRNSWLQ